MERLGAEIVRPPERYLRWLRSAGIEPTRFDHEFGIQLPSSGVDVIDRFPGRPVATGGVASSAFV
ncbi:hypothetical protein DMJ13_24730 [halophilic archaeon]|nr:hypothetical protein DMJ13_24730 [halophilic archaeon]